jgi:Domain of unknown function (DUF4389)
VNQTTPNPYPLRVDGRLDEPLSRGLWLVKWLLALPHFVVLAFLWIAFVVCTVIAFFAILFTGRYPRAIFDFNVGVLRWTWRVNFYGYGALGTDRYPPFTLRDVPDYPAHLSVDYPDHLSRGLIFVKWLLIVPQLLIVTLLTGGGAWATWQLNGDSSRTGPGLVFLLAVIAGFSLLFRNRFPRSIFDLLIGLDRWCLRVVPYVALMTDVYPPFRLDQGGEEPERTPVDLDVR